MRTQRVSGRTCLLPVEHARVDGNATQRVLHPFAPLTRQDAIDERLFAKAVTC